MDHYALGFGVEIFLGFGVQLLFEASEYAKAIVFILGREEGGAAFERLDQRSADALVLQPHPCVHT